MPITKTFLQTLTTQSGALASSGVDVSGITGDFTVKLRIHALSVGNNARFVLEESTNAFSTVIPTGVGWNSATGLTTGPEGITLSWKRRDFGALCKAGVTNGEMRLNLVELDGGSTQYECWIES